MRKIYLLGTFLLPALILFAQNPVLLKDVFPGSAGSSIRQMVPAGNYTFFNALDGSSSDRGLYRTDGTPAGTVKLNLTYPGYISTKADKLTRLGEKVVFAGDNLPYYGEVWVSNGTQEGTVALERFQPTSAGRAETVFDMAACNGFVYYSVHNTDNRFLLKRTAGAAGDMTVVYDFGALHPQSEVIFFKVVNNVLYFILYDTGTGYDQLWRSDGTTAGTFLLKNFGTAQYLASYLMPTGNAVYFVAVTPGTGDVLWKSDGTADGTGPLKTINATATTGLNNYPAFTAIGNTLFFSGNDNTNGKELWQTDGTTAGTRIVADIYAGSGGSNPAGLTVYNGTVYFAAQSSAWGREMFRYVPGATDATLVRDINPGAANSNPGGLVVSNNTLLFQANNGQAGAELWISDGTSINTKQVADINPGAASAAPTLLTASGNNIYFSANNGVNGAELFRYNNSGGITTGVTYQTIYVNDNSTTGDIYTSAIGNDANPGTPEAPVATITKAIALAQAGYTILVDAGTYTEQVTIDKGLSVKGTGMGNTIIARGSATDLIPVEGSGEPGIIQTTFGTGNVFIDNITIDGCNGTTTRNGPNCAVVLQTGGAFRNSEIKNMLIQAPGGMEGNGLYVYGNGAEPGTIIITGNKIEGIQWVGLSVQNNLSTTINNNSIVIAGQNYGMAVSAGAWGSTLPFLSFQNNELKNYTGFGLAVNAINATITNNSFVGSGQSLQHSGPAITTACNWFGTTDKAAIAAKISGNVTYTPWLVNGTDTDPGSVGFQPAADACVGNNAEYYVNDAAQTGDRFTTAIGNDDNPGTKEAPFATLSRAYTVAPVGSTIYMDAGTYDLLGTSYAFTKAVNIVGANYDKSPNDAADKRQANAGRNPESVLTNFTANIQSSYLSFEGFTFDVGNRTGFSLTNSVGTNNDFGNFQFRKNVWKIASGLAQLTFTGKLVTSPAKPVTSGFTIEDNRFEKSGTQNGTTFTFSYVKNVSVKDNVFVVTGTTYRTQTALYFGNTGIVDRADVTGNLIDYPATAMNGQRLTSGTISDNIIDNSGVVLSMTNSIPDGTAITFRNNSMTNTTGGTPFINYNRTGTSLGGTANSLLLENNTVTGMLPQGSTNQFAAFLNLTFNNSVLDPSVTIRGNKITYSGDFSQSQSYYNRPLTVRGNIKTVNISENEIVYEGGAMLPYSAAFNLPENPAITINTDFNNIAWMPNDAAISITNNIIRGFKQSVVFYDPTSTGKDTYVGYGNIYPGCSVTVNNNSFTGDNISINNGTTGAAQTIQATCNWFGATSGFASKLTSEINYTPWLVSGTDASTATGFQPVPNSCTGTPPVVTVDGQTNIGCKDGATGAINITVTGGGTPYTFAWTKVDEPSFGSAEMNPTALRAGVYRLLLTDTYGSTATAEVTLTEPAMALSASTTGSNVLCYGGSTGAASVTATGGTAPYTYAWTNTATTSTTSNLTAGTYTVTVTDANGCTVSATQEIMQPGLLTATVTGTSTACNNNASVAAGGGTAPYTYLWSNGATTATLTDVAAGTYTVTVTDANGCTAVGSIVLNRQAFNPSAAVTNVSCFGGSNGTFTITNANAVAPLTYSINGSAYQTGNVFSGLAAGTYTVAVKDANGCVGFVTKTISEPPVLTITGGSVTKTCAGQAGGSITITVSGGTPAYAFAWTGPNGFVSSKQNVAGLAAGSYIATVSDKNGCTAVFSANVIAYPAITVSPVVSAIACRGEANGAISLTVAGGSGAGFTYLWNNGATTKDLANLAAGNYTVTITDPSTACSIAQSYTISQPAALLALTAGKTNATGCASLGTITATGSGGTAPYLYRLNSGSYQSSGSFANLNGGDYTVWVKDANGCTTSKLVSITDNGSDQYETNNSKNAAKAIPVGEPIFARIALSTDVADWFMFNTPAGGGQYTVYLQHPTVAYNVALYPSTKNAAALVPSATTANSKQYTLAGNATYYISITGGLSYTCYNLLVSQVSFTTSVYTGTKEQLQEAGLLATQLLAQAYPNPHQGRFALQVTSPRDGMATVEMFTASGQKLAQKRALVKKGVSQPVTFAGMPPGMLFYRVSVGDLQTSGKITGLK